MKPSSLNEVLALLRKPELQSWWAEVQQRRSELAAAHRAHREVLADAALADFQSELSQKAAIDTLYRAGELDDAAASMLFETTELENRSYRAVSDFEEQRFKVSEIWYRLGAAEKALDERRDEQAAARSKKSESELAAADRAYRALREEYDRETERRNRLWEEVEQIWAKSAEVSLLVAEHRLRAKRVRKEAEALFAEAEEGKRRAGELRSKAETANSRSLAAENQLRVTLERAREQFGCAVGGDFLYFLRKDNPKIAICVSLVEDQDNYNLELTSLTVYLADRQRGVAFLEPSGVRAPAGEEEGNRRFEEYLLRGRKGVVPPAASS